MQRQCDRHGAYEAYAVPGHVQLCPRCADDRHDIGERARRNRAEQRLRQEKLRELHSVAQIPRRFRDVTLGDYEVCNNEQALALAVCTAYANTWAEQSEKGATLFLLGQCGTGKTMLAAAIGNSVIATHMGTVYFGSLADYCREVRSTFSAPRGGKTEGQVIQSLRQVDLLVIDDVGASSETERDLKTLFDIVDGRWRDGRPTIITSNLDMAQLKGYLGVRIMERLVHHHTVVAFNGESYRTQGALL